uniref:Cytochrome P450 n=1 Tax=Ditylenchus dipsaci TaxID=166011 RepID=A0A915DKD4_9BILA
MISSVLYDEKIFAEPNKFMPERFIENGQLKKCEELIPFSLGKRQCLGESLARAELFLFTSNLFYLYKIGALTRKSHQHLIN